jgi:P2-related tail formation protein
LDLAKNNREFVKMAGIELKQLAGQCRALRRRLERATGRARVRKTEEVKA